MNKVINKSKGSLKGMRIAVIMGGVSAERGISLLTGDAVYRSLKKQGFKVSRFDIRERTLDRFFRLRTDFAFIALHGKWGEDGLVQSVLEMRGIEYSGSGPLASAQSLDKAVAKQVMINNRIPTPDFRTFTRKDLREGRLKQMMRKLPLVIKPVSQGSAIGIGIAESAGEVVAYAKKALRYDDSFMTESFIAGREISVGILGERTLPTVEIIPRGRFYDYRSKYEPAMSEHIIPARIPAGLNKKVHEYAIKLFNALGCRVMARVDMIIDKKNRPFVLEINTIPGMTATSLLPDAAKSIGVCFDELVLEIIRHSKR